jgi:hypothetical protein
VTNPKYQPNTYLAAMHSFGRPNLYVQWIPTRPLWRTDESDVEYALHLRAAQLQHEYAVKIRKALRSRGVTVTEFALAAGMKPARVLKTLRGAIVMHLDDIAAGDVFLGRVSEFDTDSGHQTTQAAKSDLRPALGNADEKLRIGQAKQKKPGQRYEYGGDFVGH